MAGIVSYGAYVPFYRLPRSEISKAWGSPVGRGEKAVANFDEDSITMAVAAGLNCIKGFEDEIDTVFFASTTSPYHEKMAASVVAGAMGLERNVRTADFANSLRAGTTALRSAIDAVDAGSSRKVLVVSSDTRMGYPKGKNEMTFGDGAAALIIGDSNPAVTVEGAVSISEEFHGAWRTAGERFIRNSEDRFARERGYTRLLPEIISSTLKKCNLSPRDIAKATFFGPDMTQHKVVGKKMGFDAETQVQDPLLNSIGNTGAAAPLMILISALEDSSADQNHLLASYGDGCDGFVFRTTKEIDGLKGKRGIKHYLSNKNILNDYMKYVLWKDLIPTEPQPRPPQPPISIAALWRDREWGLALRGVKCMNCGTIQFPMQRVCVECGATDKSEPYDFREKVGTLTTYSHDNLAASVDPPTTICAVDFRAGGRIMCNMTDRDMDEVKTGMKVEMTFRKLHTVGGIHNYFWKCVPWRG